MRRWLVTLPMHDPPLAPFVLWADEREPGQAEPFHIAAGIAYFLGIDTGFAVAAPYQEQADETHLPRPL